LEALVFPDTRKLGTTTAFTAFILLFSEIFGADVLPAFLELFSEIFGAGVLPAFLELFSGFLEGFRAGGAGVPDLRGFLVLEPPSYSSSDDMTLRLTTLRLGRAGAAAFWGCV
jgi:hypothetical protein